MGCIWEHSWYIQSNSWQSKHQDQRQETQGRTPMNLELILHKPKYQTLLYGTMIGVASGCMALALYILSGCV